MKHHKKLQELYTRGIDDTVIEALCKRFINAPVETATFPRKFMTQLLFTTPQHLHPNVYKPLGIEDEKMAMYIIPLTKNTFDFIMFADQEREGEHCFAALSQGTIILHEGRPSVTNQASYSFNTYGIMPVPRIWDHFIAKDIKDNFYVAMGHLTYKKQPMN